MLQSNQYYEWNSESTFAKSTRIPLIWFFVTIWCDKIDSQNVITKNRIL